MLVLTRKPGEKVLIGDGIGVTVAEVKGNKVRLAFEAPDDVRILRAELASQPKQRPPINGLEVGKHHRFADPEPPNYRSEWELAENDRTSAGQHHSTTVSSATRLLPKTEHTGMVKIITFTAGQVRLENVIATELEGLTDDLGQCHLLLDFSNVENVTNVELGTLVRLHKKMKSSGGRLTLLGVTVDARVGNTFLVRSLRLFER